MGGVFVPIIIEFAAKGADVAPSVPIKVSGLVGVGVGAVSIVSVYAVPQIKNKWSAKSKDALMAFGAANLATGISILVLEQLRKSACYTFRDVEIGRPNGESLTSPVGEVIKEV